MKLKSLSTIILVGAMEFILLAAVRPGLAQTDLNAQLREALCAQNWGQAIAVLDRMKRAARPEYASQIILYRARVQVLARQNVKLSTLMDGCSTPTQPNSAPANNPIPPAPDSVMPPAPGGNMPPVPGSNIPPTPGSNMPPVPSNNMAPVPGSNIPPAPGGDVLPVPPP